MQDRNTAKTIYRGVYAKRVRFHCRTHEVHDALGWFLATSLGQKAVVHFEIGQRCWVLDELLKELKDWQKQFWISCCHSWALLTIHTSVWTNCPSHLSTMSSKTISNSGEAPKYIKLCINFVWCMKFLKHCHFFIEVEGSDVFPWFVSPARLPELLKAPERPAVPSFPLLPVLQFLNTSMIYSLRP